MKFLNFFREVKIIQAPEELKTYRFAVNVLITVLFKQFGERKIFIKVNMNLMFILIEIKYVTIFRCPVPPLSLLLFIKTKVSALFELVYIFSLKLYILLKRQTLKHDEINNFTIG